MRGAGFRVRRPIAAINLRRLGAVARKETIQLRRDARSLIMAFALPLFLTGVFGAAISLDVRDIPFAVLDRDRSPASRELVEATGSIAATS